MDKKLAALAEEVEAALEISDELAKRVLNAVEAITDKPVGREVLDSTDMVLDLIYSLRPGWSVNVRGLANKPNGHWRCSLRRSFSRDNDEYIGIGRGPTLPHALLAAMLKAFSLAVR